MEENLINIVLNSSICEIRAWPKPGNVHKTKNFPNTTYQDFLTTIYAFQEDWMNLYHLLSNDIKKNEKNLSLRYTDFLNSAIKHMMNVQQGGNVLLGHLMLLTPLFISSVYAKKKKNNDEENFWKLTKSIISNSEPENTISLYKAIRIAQPGGMGSRKRYDLFNENAFTEILEDKMNLQKIFELSKNYDLISYELSMNYNFIRFKVQPKIKELIDEYDNEIKEVFKKITNYIIKKDLIDIEYNFNELIVRIFLYILSIQADSLIIRKCGIKSAEKVSKEAAQLFKNYYKIDKALWYKSLKNFDEKLHESNGKLNPGTTADLLAASIYIKLIYNFLNI